MKKVLKRIIITIFIITLIVVTINFLELKTFKINGHSMNPTLYEGEIVLSKKTSIELLKRQDLIVFKNKGNVLVKRVIGLPDDVIDIKNDGTVYVNEAKMDEDYVLNSNEVGEITYPYHVPKKSVFVLGDNRKDSMDSRIISFGTIKEDEIIGKVTNILYKPKNT